LGGEQSTRRREQGLTLTGVGVTEEVELVDRLRAGDEDAFATVVRRHHPAMVRLASVYVPNRDVAEEVAQEAWLGVVRGIEKFEGRSSLKTWLFRIVVNRARSAGVREHRETPTDLSDTAVPPDRFGPDGGWVEPPVPWTEQVEDRLTAEALLPRVRGCLNQLQPIQAQVVTLRDVDGLSAGETCAILQISEANQRVLLHRGRAKLRALLDAELREG
jgi:RNA polymerase sigma-70 factor, ECF subfamily